MSYLPSEPFHSWSTLDQDHTLVMEELCRVIASARRYQTVSEAAKALQNARRIRDQIVRETIQFHCPPESACERNAAMAEAEAPHDAR